MTTGPRPPRQRPRGVRAQAHAGRLARGERLRPGRPRCARVRPGRRLPPYVIAAATAVAVEPGSFGIVLGGSGNGEAIAANKVVGIRAALVWTETTARLAREHNDANVISLGARQYGADEAVRFVATFLGTAFSGDQRHARRLGQVADYERSGAVPDPRWLRPRRAAGQLRLDQAARLDLGERQVVVARARHVARPHRGRRPGRASGGCRVARAFRAASRLPGSSTTRPARSWAVSPLNPGPSSPIAKIGRPCSRIAVSRVVLRLGFRRGRPVDRPRRAGDRDQVRPEQLAPGAAATRPEHRLRVRRTDRRDRPHRRPGALAAQRLRGADAPRPAAARLVGAADALAPGARRR